MKLDVKLYRCSWIREEYFVNICPECGPISSTRDLLSWWLPKKDTIFEVRTSRHSRVRYEFINDEEGLFSINNIVLWSHPSNRPAALSSGLWEVVIEEALFCAIAMVGSTRKGKELVFECKLTVTQNGVRFFVFALILPLDYDPRVSRGSVNDIVDMSENS